MEVYVSTSQTLKNVGDSQRLEKGGDLPFKEALGWSEAPSPELSALSMLL